MESVRAGRPGGVQQAWAVLDEEQEGGEGQREEDDNGDLKAGTCSCSAARTQMPIVWPAWALSPEQADQLEKEGVQQACAVLDEEQEEGEHHEEDNGDDTESVRARRLPTRTTPATDRRGRRGRGGRGRGGRRRGPGFGNVEQAEELTNDPELATGAATGQYIHVPPEQRMLTVDLAGMMERMRLASGVPEGVLAGENRNSFAAN